jgi:hypothetical protein
VRLSSAASGTNDSGFFDVVGYGQQLALVDFGGKCVVFCLQSQDDGFQVADPTPKPLILIEKAHIVAAYISKESLGHG